MYMTTTQQKATTQRKITPVIWFDGKAQEAINEYVSVFEDSQLMDITRYPDHVPDLGGKVMNGRFKIAGQELMAFDGGPQFKPTPAISFFVDCTTTQQVDDLFEKLSKDGSVLMPLQAYPFSDRYAWVEDRFGVSWQLFFGGDKSRVTPALLFVGDQHGNAEPAMKQYTSLFPDSEIGIIDRYGPDEGGAEGAVRYAEFTLRGQLFRAMESNLDHQFTFTSGTSFMVHCESQQEVDRYWDALVAGGEAQPCGWLKDRFGVAWQIIPRALPRLLADPDAEKSERVMEAMLKMKRIVVKDLEKAAEQA